ncbi:Fre7p [Sugiyamaella lignohabitans]|uniref:ferric-chelate reductase (NADPH) n=1 Tax=Sugiyamaella lignohabitans TaxID=796027 RepID=A0A167ELB8_9ASCO|nr:Fre7p [Sugiyamaella lignohabitans]ANB14209.1 Fre7p [Sugiyamaella lignohabitans]
MRVGYQDGVVYDCLVTDTPEYAAGQAIASKQVPWMSNIKYGNYTVYFVVVVIFIAMVHRLYSIFSDASYRSQRARDRAATFSVELKSTSRSSDKISQHRETTRQVTRGVVAGDISRDASTTGASTPAETTDAVFDNQLVAEQSRDDTVDLKRDRLTDGLTGGPDFKRGLNGSDLDFVPNSNPSGLTAPVRKMVALVRYIGYRRFPTVWTETVGVPSSVGAVLLLGAGFLYLLLWCFIPRSYYKACIAMGSPPLGIRSGLMANALTPFIYAFAGKINIVTFITGTSYEKLNVFHRGVAWISFFFALVHTVVFLVQPAWEGGAKYLKEYFMATPQYTSGVVATVFLFVLSIFSLQFIRQRYYEAFLHVHWPVAIGYLGILFWHDTGALASWSFLWATIGVLLSGYLYRYFYKTNYLQLRRNWFSLDEAVLRVLDDGVVQVNVFSSIINKWKPGQHVYLRFPEIQPLGNHPFSVASLPEIIDKTDGTAKLRFIAKAHGGFTKMLYEQAAKKTEKEYQVMLDGPYGGVERDLYAFDDVCLVACGSGVTATIAFLSDLSNKLATVGPPTGFPMATQKVRFLWIVRNCRNIEWFRNEITNALESVPSGLIEVYIHITGNQNMDSKQEIRPFDSPHIVIEHGPRPKMNQILRKWSESFGRRTLVVTSGVRGLNCDVGNTVADLQKLVLLGKTNTHGIQYEEISLHTEMFGW